VFARDLCTVVVHGLAWIPNSSHLPCLTVHAPASQLCHQSPPWSLSSPAAFSFPAVTNSSRPGQVWSKQPKQTGVRLARAFLLWMASMLPACKLRARKGLRITQTPEFPVPSAFLLFQSHRGVSACKSELSIPQPEIAQVDFRPPAQRQQQVHRHCTKMLRASMPHKLQTYFFGRWWIIVSTVQSSPQLHQPPEMETMTTVVAPFLCHYLTWF
jgi:hypothetical protein